MTPSCKKASSSNRFLSTFFNLCHFKVWFIDLTSKLVYFWLLSSSELSRTCTIFHDHAFVTGVIPRYCVSATLIDETVTTAQRITKLQQLPRQPGVAHQPEWIYRSMPRSIIQVISQQCGRSSGGGSNL